MPEPGSGGSPRDSGADAPASDEGVDVDAAAHPEDATAQAAVGPTGAEDTAAGVAGATDPGAPDPGAADDGSGADAAGLDPATSPDPAGATAPDEPAPAVPGEDTAATAPKPEGTEGVLQAEWLERVPWYTVPALLLGVPALAAIVGWLSRDFYLNVIWRYYWGPIVADGTEVKELMRGGVVAEAGYNVVNTLSWAALLFICVLGAAQLLHRLRVPMDRQMIVAASCWVVTGSVFHVLQDSQLFRQPLEFFFITPPIWLIYAAFGVGSMALGAYFRYVQHATGSLERALQKVWFLFIIFVLAYSFLWLAEWDQVLFFPNPVYVAVYAVVAFIAVRMLAQSRGEILPWHCVATFSIGWFLLSVHYYVLYWQDPWPPRFPDDALRYAIWVVPLLALVVVAATAGVARWLAQRGRANAIVFTHPINLLIVFSHMVDAFSTAVGVDLGGYEEKHVLSEAVRQGSERLMGGLGWDFGAAHPTFIGFAAVKLVVSLLVIYAIDVDAAKSGRQHPIMMNLIKLAVIMVGLGPGVRNTLRMTLGI